MATTTVLTEATAERATRILTMTITDASGSAFKPNTLTLTLYNKEDGAIINSRTASNILDANGGSVTAGGVLTLTLAPADNVIVLSRTGKTEEVHCALLEWTRTSDSLAGKHTIEFPIEDHSKVS